LPQLHARAWPKAKQPGKAFGINSIFDFTLEDGAALLTDCTKAASTRIGRIVSRPQRASPTLTARPPKNSGQPQRLSANTPSAWPASHAAAGRHAEHPFASFAAAQSPLPAIRGTSTWCSSA
jgi:hypothetical protein